MTRNEKCSCVICNGIGIFMKMVACVFFTLLSLAILFAWAYLGMCGQELIGPIADKDAVEFTLPLVCFVGFTISLVGLVIMPIAMLMDFPDPPGKK